MPNSYPSVNTLLPVGFFIYEQFLMNEVRYQEDDLTFALDSLQALFYERFSVRVNNNVFYPG